MRERAGVILEHAIHEFIRTGLPITSEQLYRSGAFGIKPAMIRLELGALSDDGFFYQNHPSGGRFPTDKAYRFFAEQVLAEKQKQLQRNSAFSVLAERFLSDAREHFIECVARYMNALSVGYDSGRDKMYESGFRELMKRLDIEDKESIVGIAEDFESLPKRLSEAHSWLDAPEELWPQIFVGQSPITRSKHLSVIAGKVVHGRESFMLIVVGPKRTDYRKPLQLFKSIITTLEST